MTTFFTNKSYNRCPSRYHEPLRNGKNMPYLNQHRLVSGWFQNIFQNMKVTLNSSSYDKMILSMKIIINYVFSTITNMKQSSRMSKKRWNTQSIQNCFLQRETWTLYSNYLKISSNHVLKVWHLQIRTTSTLLDLQNFGWNVWRQRLPQ